MKCFNVSFLFVSCLQISLDDSLGKLSCILENDHFAIVVHEQIQCRYLLMDERKGFLKSQAVASEPSQRAPTPAEAFSGDRGRVESTPLGQDSNIKATLQQHVQPPYSSCLRDFAL